MAASPVFSEAAPESGIEPAPEYVAGGAMAHPLATAAIFGGVLAAGAGAYLGTRALGRRNGASEGRPVSSVMANAITACDLEHRQGEGRPDSKGRRTSAAKRSA
jgi:hypothetical protein